MLKIQGPNQTNHDRAECTSINRAALCQGQSQDQKRVGPGNLECGTLSSKRLRILSINPLKSSYSQKAALPSMETTPKIEGDDS